MTEEETYEYRRLESLANSDYEIADGDPEIQGWEITDDLGDPIGEVKDLLFNPSSSKVRYLVAALNKGIFNGIPHHILVPIGLAELHETDNIVFLPGISALQLQSAPAYSQHDIEQQYELSVLDAFRAAETVGDNRPGEDDKVYQEDNFYSRPHFSDYQFYHKRFPDRGRLK